MTQGRVSVEQDPPRIQATLDSLQDLINQARAAMLPAIRVLQQRLDAGTLLLGACRAEESWVGFRDTALRRAQGVPPPSAAVSRVAASAVGYSAALYGVFVSLQLVRLPSAPWPAP